MFFFKCKFLTIHQHLAAKADISETSQCFSNLQLSGFENTAPIIAPSSFNLLTGVKSVMILCCCSCRKTGCVSASKTAYQ